LADQIVTLVTDAANTGKKVDTSEITVGANTVQRQRLVISDDAASAGLVKVSNSSTGLTDYALNVNLSPISPVTPGKFRDLGTQQNVKSSAGVLYGLQIINTQNVACFVQVFNAAGAVTLGTEDPIMEFKVNGSENIMAPIAAKGISFSTGIRIASTTTEKGSTGSSSGVMVFIQYT
jgi:hypothetical protein